MEYIVIISVFDQRFFNNSRLFWNNSISQNLRKFLPKEENLINNIKSGYLYLIDRKPNNQVLNKTYSLQIKSIKVTTNYISIDFEKVTEIDINPAVLKLASRKYLKDKFDIDKNEITPFLIFAERKEFENILKQNKTKLEIENYFLNKNWDGIKKIIHSPEKLKSTDLWNDPPTLWKISFALSKLSECSINLKKSFKSNEEIKKFLSEKKFLRNFNELILNRCIELDPQNPTYYSSLSYFYYQSALELNFPGGRRDENFYEVIDKALINIENAIEIDFKRPNDHFRKGYILSNLLASRVRFNPNKEKIPSKFSNLNLIIEESIQSYNRVINIFESSNSNEEIRKIYFNTYLKTLYNLAALYEENIITKSEKYILILNKIFPNINFESVLNWKEYKIKKLTTALEFIIKCLRWINKKYYSEEEEPNVIRLIEIEDSLNQQPLIQTHYKSHQLAKIYFKLYLITTEKKYLNDAKNILLKTLQLKRTTFQDKLYLQNLLATIYILEDKYQLAINSLKNISQIKSLPDYIKITLSIAYLLNKDFKNAIELLETLYQKSNKLLRDEIIFWMIIENLLENKINKKLLQEMDLLKKETQNLKLENLEDIKECLNTNQNKIFQNLLINILNQNR
ncbi:MAG: hypothetical protein N3F03_06750 [Ignavibacteria bacterium]|nr:hypothetical protein [Ignavibacteria bacterium]